MIDVLVVEGSSRVAAYLNARLRQSGIAAYAVDNVGDALHVLTTVRFDAVVVDCDALGNASSSWVEDIQSVPSPPRIIAVGTRPRLEHLKIVGADCLEKPLAIDELLARLAPNSLVAAYQHKQFGNLVMNMTTCEVLVGGQPLALRPRERAFLRVLIANAPHLVTDAIVEKAVFGSVVTADANTIHVYVCRLRKQLHVAGAAVTVETERGAGFRLSIHSSHRLRRPAQPRRRSLR